MNRVEPKSIESTVCVPGQLPDGLLESNEPLLLQGLVADWPLVDAAQQSADAADSYLREFYNGKPVTVSSGPPEIDGTHTHHSPPPLPCPKLEPRAD